MDEKSQKLDMVFFSRNAKIVAQELLGKILVRKINNNLLKSKIVETEAYFGSEDPASRACQNGNLKETMYGESGTILVYGIHNNWLVNFVTGKKGSAEAVLIRAIEPLNFNLKCSGPGLLTKALKINKSSHSKSIFNSKELWIEDNKNINKSKNFEIVESFRIGVKKDLPEKLRFYIKNNKFVSKK